ncbi:WDR24 [Cordylochernes scorpioides]|uniref:GATOR2 complex protein WDR24 n=1 Tax=Cordylochernes scorpioides TaxID=51811 RepID=A0ABY6L855_9ARAC|nr:WDR24 [Cordylochernes scorpioides]
MEAEMIAACESCCQIKWIINLLRELEEWNFMEKPTAIYTDSQSLINWISSPKQSSRCRHINRKYHFLRDCYESRDICLLYKPSQDLEADIFTKDLSRDQMKKHLESLSIVGIKPKKQEVSSSFDSQSESVRDVQFSPHQYFSFVAVQENGNAQFWDIRKQDRCVKQFPAHTGPAFTCDWHPEEKKWLATAGRDRTIKIWDTSHNEPSMEYCIPSIASVAKIKWRPERKYNIASCSLVVDFNVNIWDIRRPYIAFASFTEHKDVATGICWKYDPHILFSTSKDKTLYQHVIKDAVRPADKAKPVGIAINNFGDVSHVASNRIVFENAPPPIRTGVYPAARLPAFFRKMQVHPSEQFRNSLSTCFCFSITQEEHSSMAWFVQSALRYQLSGAPLAEICNNNARVAQELNRPIIAMVWYMLKIFYNSHSPTDRKTEFEHLGGDSLQDNSKSSRHNSGNTRNHHYSGNKNAPRHLNTLTDHHAAAEPAVPTDEESETSAENPDDSLTNIATGLAAKEGYFYSDYEVGELNGMSCEAVTQETDDDWLIPLEAFQPRQPIKENVLSQPNGIDDIQGELERTELTTEESHPELLSTDIPSPPAWQFGSQFAEILSHFASEDDVQMSVSMLIILGDRISGYVSEQDQEQWFTSYLSLLTCFGLWNVANEVIRLSSLPSINTLNQESTTIHSACGRCSTRLHRCGWHCKNCKETTTICSFCHKPVWGLFAWCQSCGHGGHVNHIMAWFQTNRMCPAGCGHPSAEVVMSRLDKWINDQKNLRIKKWWRYVDDIFCEYHHEDDLLILETLHKYNSHLKFTMETERNQVLPYLDILIIRTPERYHTTVYYKQNLKPSYLHFESYNPIGHKITVVKTLTKIIQNQCSLPIFRKLEKENILKNLSLRGYSSQFINRHSFNASQYRNKCILLYSKCNDKIAHILRRQGIQIYFSNHQSIGQLLRNPTTKSEKQLEPKLQTNAIYSIQCRDCNATYIGETGRSIQIRLNEHNRNIKTKHQGANRSVPAIIPFSGKVACKTTFNCRNSNFKMVVLSILSNYGLLFDRPEVGTSEHGRIIAECRIGVCRINEVPNYILGKWDYFVGLLTFKEIETIAKTKINKNWRIPPKHSWYSGVNPGGALKIRNRQHQTTLTRFRTGHLKPLKIENNR